MTTATITTITKIIELLPENQQERTVEHLKNYIFDLRDEIGWDIKFKNTQSELSKIAKKVKKEIARGKAEEFNYKRLRSQKPCLPFGKHMKNLT